MGESMPSQGAVAPQTAPPQAQAASQNQSAVAVEYGFFGCLLNFRGIGASMNLAAAMGEGARESWFTDMKCRLMWCAVEEVWKSNPAKGEIAAITFVLAAKKIAKQKKSPFAGVDISPAFLEEANRYGKTLEDIRAYAKALRDAEYKRSCAQILIDGQAALSGGDADSISDVVARLNKAALERSGVKDLPMERMTSNVIAKFETAYQKYFVEKDYDYVSGLPLPWRTVSRRIDGIPPGITVIGARPSVGKSSFALNILEYLAERGCHCAFNCIDMAAEMICRRPFATMSEIPLNRLLGGLPDFPKVRPRLLEIKRKLDKWNEDALLTMEHMTDIDKFKAWCIQRREQGKLDLVAVDYIQMLRAKGNFSSTNAELEYIAGELKDLATQYELPVLALSQLSRAVTKVDNKNGGGAEQREPTMADLRGSGAIEQDATMVILLYNDEAAYRQWGDNGVPLAVDPYGDGRPPENKKPSVAPVWVKIEKNQNGDGGLFPFVVHHSTFTWFLGDPSAAKVEGVGVAGGKNLQKFMRVTPDKREFAAIGIMDKRGGVVEASSAPIVEPPPEPPKTVVQPQFIGSGEMEYSQSPSEEYGQDYPDDDVPF